MLRPTRMVTIERQPPWLLFIWADYSRIVRVGRPGIEGKKKISPVGLEDMFPELGSVPEWQVLAAIEEMVEQGLIVEDLDPEGAPESRDITDVGR